MSDFINIGKGKQAEAIDTKEMQKGGVNKASLKEDLKSIFEKFDKDKNNVLDEQEISELMDTIKSSAGKKKHFEKEVTLSDKEAEKLLK